MSNQYRRLSLAKEVACAWNKEGLPYSVVHGLAKYPKRIGRDLDIVVDKQHVDLMIERSLDVAKRHGFNNYLLRWSYWGLFQLVLIDTDNMVSLPLDFMCTTEIWQAKIINMIDDEDLARFTSEDALIGEFKTSQEGTFVKACLRPLICGDLSRFGEGKEFALPVNIPECIEAESLEDIVGSYGLKMLKSNNLESMRHFETDMVKTIQLDWIKRHPYKAVKNIIKAINRHVMLRAYTVSKILVVECDDPARIINLLEEMQSSFKSIFIDLKIVLSPKTILYRKLGYLIKWRTKPVSEFVLYVVIQRDGSKQGKAGLKRGRGRIFLEPDACLSLTQTCQDSNILLKIKEAILSLMFAIYSNKISI